MSTETALERVQRILAEHGLPQGLLPNTIASGRIDEETGRFDVELAEPIERTFEGIRVAYAKRIQGTIHPGSIDGLKGVKAKRGLWVPVSSILAAGSSLLFSVGPVSKALPRAAFE
jgi:hypothetical protein